METPMAIKVCQVNRENPTSGLTRGEWKRATTETLPLATVTYIRSRYRATLLLYYVQGNKKIE